MFVFSTPCTGDVLTATPWNVTTTVTEVLCSARLTSLFDYEDFDTVAEHADNEEEVGDAGGEPYHAHEGHGHPTPIAEEPSRESVATPEQPFPDPDTPGKETPEPGQSHDLRVRNVLMSEEKSLRNICVNICRNINLWIVCVIMNNSIFRLSSGTSAKLHLHGTRTQLLCYDVRKPLLEMM